MNRCTISVDPADALIDVPRRIVVSAAVPGETVEIASRTMRAGVVWHSRASFVADAQGRIDLTQTAPVAGDYSGISAMGLIWAQTPQQAGRREMFSDNPTDPLTTVVSATSASGAVQAEFIQRLRADGVTRTEVREDGLVGTLFQPSGPGPHPAIIVLNGSGGGMNEPRAALYASYGYAALALGYFKAPGLSDYISNTPLEYFKKGLDWVRRTLKPRHDFVALSGQSRGGELVLLLGATYPEAVSAVVAYVPGALVHSGQNAADPAIGRDGPAWLLNGEPLPHLWQNNRTASWRPFDEGAPPHRHTDALLTALQDKEAVARARIAVEKIRGPVMLLSATDDGSWPSSLYTAMVKGKLEQVGHPYPVCRHDYDDAGHAILFPYLPTTQLTYAHPVSGRISTTGGKPCANAVADEHSWNAVRQFLEQAVQARQAHAEQGSAAHSFQRKEHHS